VICRRKFKKIRVIFTLDSEKFSLNLRYIYDTLIGDSLHVITIDIWAFVPLWHGGLYLDIEEVNVRCL
jgi:hypothetical protein